MENVVFNKCQTPLEDLHLDQYPNEVVEQFWDYLNNVPFIKWIVSPDRPYVHELPRDDQGRAIIDVTHPPILENSDFFRSTAKVWEETGSYTKLRPNRNPNSDFGRWLKEERRRGWEGYTDPSTGMWVTGDYYWMLNYCPMHLIEKRKDGFEIRVVKPPKFWDGQFLVSHYFLQARLHKHQAAELASRGKGKTTLGAAMLAKRFIIGETAENQTDVQCLCTAADKTKLIGTNQILSVFKDDIDFAAKNTQFASHRLKSSTQELTWKMGYKMSGSDIEYGSKNEVSGIISGVNQDKLNGSRGVLYLIEEAGIFKDLLNMYNLIRPSVEQGSSVFGEIVAYGTAGDEQSDFTAFAEMIYSPDGYNMEPLDNVYDKEGQGRKKITVFYPAYMNYDNTCIDKDGNSDVTKALLMLLYDRYKVKYGSTDINTITKRISQYPITPQEAIVRSQGNVFPVTELNERLNQIDNNPSEYDSTYIGDLVFKGDKVEFIPTTEIPIRDYPLKDNKNSGALEIYEMPQKNSDGKIPQGRYLASEDPYDNDTSNTMSLGSILVLDLWTDRIVAEYTGRKKFADDLYELARKLCIFYNARLMYEQNIKGNFAYFSKCNSTYLLAETPDYLLDKQLITSKGYGNTAYGIRATTPIINYGFTLIRDWLLKPVPKIEKDEEGNDIEVSVPNLYFIKNRALLKELILWNPNGNYDRCVLGNTDILTDTGIEKIANINIGDRVVTADGQYNEVIQYHKNPYTGAIYKFRALGDYRNLECTYNHPILCRHKIGRTGKYWMRDRNKLSIPEYKEAQYINKDDFIFIPKRRNLPKCFLPDDLLYILGWYIADGTTSCGNYVKFMLGEEQYKIGERIKTILNKYWMREETLVPECKRREREREIIQPAHYRCGHVEAKLFHSKLKYKGKQVKMWVVEIASKEAQRFFNKYGGTPNHKDIADTIYNSTGLIPLLRGFFEGDGHYRCSIRCDGVVRNSLEVSSVYETLIQKVRQILIDEGIWNTVRKIKVRGLMSKEQFNINIVNDAVLPIIRGSLKFDNQIPLKLNTEKKHYIEDENGFWVKVRNISHYDYSGYVYNIGVNSNHTYCANGIITHNCMSLVQLMLYREEKMILFQGDVTKQESTSSGMENDDYWSKNYPGKISDRVPALYRQD